MERLHQEAEAKFNRIKVSHTFRSLLLLGDELLVVPLGPLGARLLS